MSRTSEYHPFRSESARDEYLAFYDAQAAHWPVPSESRMVATEEGQTYVRISGPVGGPPLVLLPAGRSNSTCWTPLVADLAETFRVFAVDAIYDDGRSVNTRPIKTMDDATAWIDHLLDALGLEGPVRMAGISFGAWIAGEYALHAPGRVERLVWLSPVGVLLPMSGEFLARSMLCMVPSRKTFEWVTRWIMPDAAERDRDFFDGAVAEMVLSEKCFRFRMWPGNGPRKFTDDELAGLQMPVLYVVGEHERICSDVNAAIARAETAPAVSTAVIPQAGHDAMWVATEAVRDAVVPFLES